MVLTWHVHGMSTIDLTMSHIFQELKQDISSFRYEVLGMMKGNKPGLQTSKGSTGASNITYSDHPMKSSTAPTGEQLKGKFKLFSVTASILQQNSKANTKNTEHCLANGSIPTTSEITSCNRTRSDFSGLYHQIRHRGTNNPGRVYSKCEEVSESDTEELGEINKSDKTAESLIMSKAKDDKENEIDESSENEKKEVQNVTEERNQFSDISCICDDGVNDESMENDEEISRL